MNPSEELDTLAEHADYNDRVTATDARRVNNIVRAAVEKQLDCDNPQQFDATLAQIIERDDVPTFSGFVTTEELTDFFTPNAATFSEFIMNWGNSENKQKDLIGLLNSYQLRRAIHSFNPRDINASLAWMLLDTFARQHIGNLIAYTEDDQPTKLVRHLIRHHPSHAALLGWHHSCHLKIAETPQ